MVIRPQEGNYLFLGLVGLHVEKLLGEGSNGVVYGGNLGRVDSVFLYNGLTGEVAHGDDVVGVGHTVLLYSEHGGIDIAARAVEVGGVYMDHQRLSCHLLGMDAGGIGEPVVGVDYVEIECAGYDAGADGIIVYLLKKIVRVTA